MNKALLEAVLAQMKDSLKTGAAIGDLKIAALFALGSQLEAIFYYLGHELASKIDVAPVPGNDPKKIIAELNAIADQYKLGKISPRELGTQQITFSLTDGYSTRFLATDKLRTQNTFCSFEAGLFAGLVEKMTGNPVFSQEINCKCQGKPDCEFMVVFA